MTTQSNKPIEPSDPRVIVILAMYAAKKLNDATLSAERLKFSWKSRSANGLPICKLNSPLSVLL